MKKFCVDFVESEEKVLYGLYKESSDKTQREDIKALSKRFYGRSGKDAGSTLPFYVVSKEYNEQMGDFILFVGSDEKNLSLLPEKLPASLYVKMEIRPKLGFLWGLSIGEAKRWFYKAWLPNSSYEAVNLEYEFHTEKSTGKRPSIDLFFAVQKRGV